MTIAEQIQAGETTLGIEMGSTRVKAVLIDKKREPVASGGFAWENTLDKGIWTYSLDLVHQAMKSAYGDLKKNIRDQYGVTLKKVKAMGVSGMMHGYLVFDGDDNLLVPFRTWRNNITEIAAEELSGLFSFPIPQRWSIAHLHQSILNREEHIGRIAYMTTLAGYVHKELTGQQVIGIGEASGMFPIDSKTGDFRRDLIEKFNERNGSVDKPWRLEEILPRVLCAGDQAGELTEKGAAWLDPEGDLEAGIPLCPPEGDAGTGMVATNSVSKRTGNVSAGTSVFAMVVLEEELSRLHQELDLVTTPDGNPVAMVHSNNCTSDFNAWVSLLGEAAEALGASISSDKLFETFMNMALKGAKDCSGLLSYGYLSGEHLTGFSEGRPLFVRTPGSPFNLADFLRSHLYSSLCALKAGTDILTGEEKVEIDEIKGHGGFFKTPGVGQSLMAAALNTPVSVMETAGEGGAWGMALLAAYMSDREKRADLPSFLSEVFAGAEGKVMNPDPADVEGFSAYFKNYMNGLPVERAAVDYL